MTDIQVPEVRIDRADDPNFHNYFVRCGESLVLVLKTRFWRKARLRRGIELAMHTELARLVALEEGRAPTLAGWSQVFVLKEKRYMMSPIYRKYMIVVHEPGVETGAYQDKFLVTEVNEHLARCEALRRADKEWRGHEELEIYSCDLIEVA